MFRFNIYYALKKVKAHLIYKDLYHLMIIFFPLLFCGRIFVLEVNVYKCNDGEFELRSEKDDFN